MCIGYADLSALNTGSSKKFNSPLFILLDQPDLTLSKITWSGSVLHFASKHNKIIDAVFELGQLSCHEWWFWIKLTKLKLNQHYLKGLKPTRKSSLTFVLLLYFSPYSRVKKPETVDKPTNYGANLATLK